MSFRYWALALALVAAFAGSRADAQTTYTWQNFAGGNFNTAANWSPNPVVSNNTNTVEFGGTTSYTATHDLATAPNQFIANKYTFNNSDAAGTGVTLAVATGNRFFRLAGMGATLTQDGAGAVRFTGPLQVNANATVTGAGTGAITIDTLRLAANLTFANAYTGNVQIGTLTLESSQNFTNQKATGTVTITGPVYLSNLATTGRTLTIQGAQSTTVSGIIADFNGAGVAGSLTKAGGNGVLTLSNVANTYTGVTTLTAGTVAAAELANGGAVSSIGASSAAASNLVFNGGILRYTGAGAATDRLFTLAVNGAGASSGALFSSGTGAVNFTNTGAIAFTGTVAGTRTLVLQGTFAGGTNTLAALVGDANTAGGDLTALTKGGVSTWALTGANTYTGGTTVNAGTLVAANTTGSATGFGSLVVNIGGTLAGTGTVDPTGTNTITIAGAVAPGTVGTVGTLTLSADTALSGVYGFDLSAAGTAGVAADSGGSDGGATPAVHDVLAVVGNLDLSGTTVNLNGVGATGFDPALSYSYVIATATGTITGTPVLGTVTGFGSPGGTFSFGGIGGQSLYLNYTPVPEPVTVLAVAAAGLGLAGLGRRRQPH